MKPKLVIFDLDGTLLDTIDDLKEAVNHAMSLRGFPTFTREEVMAMVALDFSYIQRLFGAVRSRGRVCQEKVLCARQYG